MEVRMSGGPPWGFSLVGGTDFRSPLRVGKVSVNGKAEKAGVAAGYYLLKINGVDCSNLKHMEAQRLVKSARETLELNLAVVELRRKTSQTKMLEPRRTSTSSLPRGMTSLSSYGSRFSYHDDQSAFMYSPRSSSSSIGGADHFSIPAKPAPPPGSRPKSADVGKLAAVSNTVKEPSPVEDVFNKSITEEAIKPSEDTTTTTTTTSTVRRPPPPPTVTPKKPVTKPEVTKSVAPQNVTKPIPEQVTKPVAQQVTKPVAQEVTKPVEKVTQKQPFKSPISTSATYIPSAPKSEGGSSWYKSMFRSMLANDDNDEVTIPAESVTTKHQGKVHNAAAAFVAAANENASKSVSPRHEPSGKPHSSVSSFSTIVNYTATSSYKPPPSDATVVTAKDSAVTDEVINTDTTESMTSEQVRATLRQTIGKTTSANKGWVNVDQDEKTTSFSDYTIDQHPIVTGAEDVQLDKMHPIISDAAKSSAPPPPPPTVNIISPVDDEDHDFEIPAEDDPFFNKPPPYSAIPPDDVIMTTPTASSYKPHPSDVTMVTDEVGATDEPVNIDTVETMSSEQVRDAIRQTLSGTSSNQDWKDEDITSYNSHESHTLHESHIPETNLQSQVHVPDDIPLDKMHPIISDALMSEAPPATALTEDLPVTIATNTTIESTQTGINQSDFPEVKLDTMHPIISGAVVTENATTITMATEDKGTDELMKTTSDELMSALEELNTVIGTSNTSSVGVVADHVSLVVKDRSHDSSHNVSDNGTHDKGSRSNSRQSDRDNRGASRSSSRQSDRDNKGASRSSSRQSNASGHDKKSPPAESARALYNFSAQSVKELSFKKGDIIRLTRTVDNNWLEGEVDGAKGIFPTSYIELITNISGSNTPNAAMATPEPSISPVPLTTSTDLPHSIAKFKFQAESSKELSFQKGDILFLSKRVDDNWFKGYNGSGETGIFPCSYVQVVVDIPEEVEYVKSPVEIYPKVVKTSKKQAPPRPSQPPPVKGKRLEDESLKAVATGNDASSHDPTVTSFDIPGERYESLFSYEPCNSDELGLEIGDKVVVFEKCDDGWFMGTCERTGEFGAFPGNFVKKLED